MGALICGVDDPYGKFAPADRTSRRVLCPDWRARWSLAGLPPDERTDICSGEAVVDGVLVRCSHECHRLPGDRSATGGGIAISSEPAKARGVSNVGTVRMR
jgi:hypothetical protein